MDAKIVAISYWLPKGTLSNLQISEEHPEWSVDKISAKTGIYERKIAAPNTFTSDMAVNAANKLFDEHQIDRSSIDFLLLCTQSPDYFLPTTACIVQNRLGLSTSAGALDFNLGCSGYVYGLGLAKGLIVSGSAKNILLITSETYSKFIHPSDKSNKTIFGDAAAATLVSGSESLPGLVIGNLVYGTDGSGAENLIVKNGACRYPAKDGEDLKDENNDFMKNDNNLFMNGAEIFKFTSQSVPVLVDQVLRRNNMSSSDVDQYVFHQANKYMLDFIRKKIAIPEDKFFYFLKDCGNTVSSTIPIALAEAIKQNKIAMGNRILLAGFGVGYSWAGCILH